MDKEFTVVHEFMDTLGGAAPPAFRAVGTSYPPKGVCPSKKWLDYLEGYRTSDGKPILAGKATKDEEAPEVSAAE